MPQLWELKEWILLTIFLGMETIEDIRSYSVRIWNIALFGTIGILLQIFANSQSIESILIGCSVGIILILLSRCKSLGLGSGDGWIFFVAGIYMGGLYNLLLCYWSILAIAVVGSALYYYKKSKKENTRKEYPFVPFIFLSNVVLGVLEILS